MKWGAYYVRWRSVDGRRRNRRVGKVRTRGEKDGLTRAEAERESRRIIDAETDQSPVEPATPPPTVDEVVDQLRDKIAIEGARLSYRQNCASMQRVHISPAIGKQRVNSVTHRDVERLAWQLSASACGTRGFVASIRAKASRT